ncbi:RagB/SusD family nutrient uptake outer membrane protein [Ohtaekwangia koreensis]|uniref:Starch-binding associating with outer membrane n=1 Tax=Ohtaekwangia koreensis TaxID=688867 RepID=A0A1T5M6C5_9BACT|nr:RagB/SusD family nutrient uptake outer membrane protein [Ohtaekwangia koreensis]SKC83781.1 Starch-binding associating with outer membrane [Ohtaekwangia koreensis]
MKIYTWSNRKEQKGYTWSVSSGLFLLVAGLMFSTVSCNDYLDVVPDNVTTLDNAFSLKNEAEKYLFTCYSYIPKNGDGWFNIGIMAGDEIWLPQTDRTYWNPAFRIAQGNQNSNSPLLDAWRGYQFGASGGSDKRLFAGLRSCNIFLENVRNPGKVPDLTLDMRTRWIGEVEFLKAYYHYYMLRMYGPIPIIDANVSLDADVQASYVYRRPVDECVNYISALLDSSIAKLPDVVENDLQEMGRVTKPIALALKAKLWVMAASPLFNGNSDFAGFTGTEGELLFNPVYDPTKWQKAKEACKAAIDAAEGVGHKLHEYTNDPFGLADTTKIQLSVRQAVTEPWNTEVVWGNSNSYFWNSNMCQILLTGTKAQNRLPTPGVWEAPLKIAKMFYTSNGVPIEEDVTFNFTEYEQLRKATKNESYNIKTGYITARLNFDRENRFYADLGFDGGIWYKKDARSVDTAFYAQTKWADLGGAPSTLSWNETGYYIKKLVNWEMVFSDNDGTTYGQYPWPEIRLADLYLLYAEALNEVEPASTEAIVYLDKIRARAGLAGVVESWTNYSSNATKFATQDGLREIIHRERLIELAFEGHRFWDLRRWKKSAEELNKDITGWNYTGTTAATYYRETHIYSQTFVTPRDYLWPIGAEDTRKNPKLVENPGW